MPSIRLLIPSITTSRRLTSYQSNYKQISPDNKAIEVTKRKEQINGLIEVFNGIKKNVLNIMAPLEKIVAMKAALKSTAAPSAIKSDGDLSQINNQHSTADKTSSLESQPTSKDPAQPKVESSNDLAKISDAFTDFEAVISALKEKQLREMRQYLLYPLLDAISDLEDSKDNGDIFVNTLDCLKNRGSRPTEGSEHKALMDDVIIFSGEQGASLTFFQQFPKVFNRNLKALAMKHLQEVYFE